MRTSRQTAAEKTFQFIVWLVPTLEKMPRTQKFLLGDRIQSLALDVLESIIEATYTKQHRPRRIGVNERCEAHGGPIVEPQHAGMM